MKTYLFVVAIIAAVYYGHGKYVGGQDHLKMVLEYTKKHPDPKWSPMIDYYVGFVYYQQGDYSNAVLAYQQQLTDYPTGQYAPEALVKLCLASQEIREWPQATEAAARYVEEFPDGKDIKIMKTNLDALKYHHP